MRQASRQRRAGAELRNGRMGNDPPQCQEAIDPVWQLGAHTNESVARALTKAAGGKLMDRI